MNRATPRCTVSLLAAALMLAGGGASIAATPDDALSDGWWRSFGDAQLASLVDGALSGNGDLQAAWDRIEQARARALLSLSPVLPGASVDLGATLSPLDSLGFQFGGLPGGLDPNQPEPPEVYTSGQAMLNLRVPLSWWGSSVANHRAGRYEARASEGDRRAIEVTLASQIAEAWYDLLAAHERVRVTREQIDAGSELLELMELRFANGDVGGLDVLQQRQQLAASQARLPQFRNLQGLTEQRLSVLLGRDPDTELPVSVPDPATLPGLEPLAGQVPLEVLEDRPDLRAAAARVDAARTRKTGAVLNFLPSLQLTAQAGWQFIDIYEPSSQFTWGVGANLSVPLFQGAGNIASLQEASAARSAAEHSYQQLLTTALSEVRVAVIRERELHAQLVAVRAQLEAASQAEEESRARYLEGLVTYPSVLLASTTHHQAQLGLISAQRELLSARIALYDALGGRWSESESHP
jgi:NodT family efflux transporter outer membrane factor (OMF) lipoprotein